jgi:hypothetical protein
LRRRASRWCGALLVACVLAGCSGGDDSSTPDTTTGSSSTASTIPSDVDPGTGEISLEDDPVELEVTTCTGEDPASTDPSAQKLFELVSTGTPDGEEITVTATEFRSTTDDGTAVSQTVTITSQAGKETVGLEARRSYFGEKWVDLTDPTVDEPLFQSGPQIEVRANFGPQGARKGDPGIQDGALIAACPES